MSYFNLQPPPLTDRSEAVTQYGIAEQISFYELVDWMVFSISAVCECRTLLLSHDMLSWNFEPTQTFHHCVMSNGWIPRGACGDGGTSQLWLEISAQIRFSPETLRTSVRRGFSISRNLVIHYSLNLSSHFDYSARRRILAVHTSLQIECYDSIQFSRNTGKSKHDCKLHFNKNDIQIFESLKKSFLLKLCSTSDHLFRTLWKHDWKSLHSGQQKTGSSAVGWVRKIRSINLLMLTGSRRPSKMPHNLVYWEKKMLQLNAAHPPRTGTCPNYSPYCPRRVTREHLTRAICIS